MHQWIWSARAGIILGCIVFLLAFIPLLIWQYRRYGRWSAMRMLGAAATSIYVAAIATYTWMPLPPRTPEWCALNGVDVINLTPFAFMDDVRAVVQEIGRRQALRSVIVLQVVFNVVLFIPWGIIARRYFHLGFILSVMTGFLMSVFIEVTQATGLWGIYDCAYRWADIDDVIMNTAGAVGGAIIAPVVLFWMPRGSDLSASRLVARPVTVWRRWTSMLITAGAVLGVTFFGYVSERIALILVERPLESRTAEAMEAMIAVGVVGMLIYLPAILGSGNIGMYVVWLAPRWRDEAGNLGMGTLLQRLARASVTGIPVLAMLITDRDVFFALVWAVAGLSVLLAPFSKSRRSLSGMLTDDEIIDVRPAGDLPR